MYRTHYPIFSNTFLRYTQTNNTQYKLLTMSVENSLWLSLVRCTLGELCEKSATTDVAMRCVVDVAARRLRDAFAFSPHFSIRFGAEFSGWSVFLQHSSSHRRRSRRLNKYICQPHTHTHTHSISCMNCATHIKYTYETGLTVFLIFYYTREAKYISRVDTTL